MSYLSDLVKKARQWTGNTVEKIAYNTPFLGNPDTRKDTGFSEWVAGGQTPKSRTNAMEPDNYNVPLDPNGQSKLPTINPYGLPDTTKTGGNGSGNGNGGGGGTVVPPGGSNDNGMLGNAEQERQNRINAIKSRLNMMKDIADRDIASAGTIKDQILGSINEQYGDPNGDTGLFGLSKSNLGNSMTTLDNQDVNVQNTYGRAQGESRRAFESALGRNRMLAKAQGSLGSSNYADNQADTTTTGARNVAGIGDELAGKRAEIDTTRTSTNNWFKQKDLELGQEKTGLVNGANGEYTSKVNAARDLERNFGIDSEEALGQAEVDYDSKLTAIKDYINNKSIAIAQIQAQAGTYKPQILDQSNAIGSFISGQNNNNTAINRAQASLPSTITGPTADASMGNNQYGSTNKSQLATIRQNAINMGIQNPDAYLAQLGLA